MADIFIFPYLNDHETPALTLAATIKKLSKVKSAQPSYFLQSMLVLLLPIKIRFQLPNFFDTESAPTLYVTHGSPVSLTQKVIPPN